MTAPRLVPIHPNARAAILVSLIPWLALAAFALVAVGVVIGGLLL